MDYLCKNGVTLYMTGGALGFDTLAAEAVLRKKATRPDIQLVLVVPCKNQSERWCTDDKKRYEHIKRLADKVICLAEQYYDGCMLIRNRYMVDQSVCCVCFLTEHKGGTFYTVNYARKKKVKVFNIAKSKDAPSF